jgi:cell division transport system permease protein
MRAKLKMYGALHLRASLASLGRLTRDPFASLLTIAVIGIALALPATLFIVLQNTQNLTHSWKNNSTQISVYLKTNISKTRTQDLLHQLRTNPEIANVAYISPQRGLQEFSQILGNQKVIDILHKNPLPGVILVSPILSMHSSLAINQLVDTLKNLPEVDNAELDLQWLQRLNNIIYVAKQSVLALAFLLGIGVLLIIANTIRLATQNERKEIYILQLVGATNSFIRRPFLYAGIWYGLCGGLIAWIVISVILWWLKAPVAKLASSYNSDFYLQTLSAKATINLLMSGIFLGLIGAWLVISQELMTKRHHPKVSKSYLSS